jgi:hypothetical protein
LTLREVLRNGLECMVRSMFVLCERK